MLAFLLGLAALIVILVLGRPALAIVGALISYFAPWVILACLWLSVYFFGLDLLHF